MVMLNRLHQPHICNLNINTHRKPDKTAKCSCVLFMVICFTIFITPTLLLHQTTLHNIYKLLDS